MAGITARTSKQTGGKRQFLLPCSSLPVSLKCPLWIEPLKDAANKKLHGAWKEGLRNIVRRESFVEVRVCLLVFSMGKLPQIYKVSERREEKFELSEEEEEGEIIQPEGI